MRVKIFKISQVRNFERLNDFLKRLETPVRTSSCRHLEIVDVKSLVLQIGKYSYKGQYFDPGAEIHCRTLNLQIIERKGR